MNEFEEAVVVRVVDGDTILVRMADGTCQARQARDSERRVRLIGIDAAESIAPEKWRNTAEGCAASQWLKDHLPAGTHVWLQQDVSNADEFGRLLRYVWLRIPKRADSTSEIRRHMLNAVLVERGMADARSYPPDTRLDLLFESIAEQRHTG